MPAARPALRALAARLGVEEGYVSAIDQRFVPTGDATREALVAAMGVDAASEAAAARSLEEWEEPADAAEPAEAVAALRFSERFGAARGFGVWANLYTIRSSRNPGFGSFADLRALLRWAASEGAAFVGLSPLHALDRGEAFCPYSPVSRLFRDPLYLDPGAVPGAAAPAQDLRDASSLDPAGVEQRIHAVLRPLHERWRAGEGSQERRECYRAFERRQGEALRDFATFQALADLHEAETGARDWRRWPEPLRSPGGEDVRAFRAAHPAAVDYHAWLQFELEEQLRDVGREAKARMAIGLYADLALGSAPGGFDTWWRPGLFARGVSAGAPPDAFSLGGQDWGFPPPDPHAWRREGFAFWRRMLEANLCGAGALRIDHVLGLRRLFWIPEGRPPGEGAYVRCPEAELLAVLCETSRRHDALLIGEDLGTVPGGFSEGIRARGLLSSRVLLFERDAEGFRASERWPAECLATLNTHDLPPLSGWLSDADLPLRRATGQIADDAAAERIRRDRRDDREALRRRLRVEGDLPEADGPGASEDDVAWLCATTRFLGRTPAVLVGLSLDDLAGEREPINLPGVPPSRHRSWVRRMGSSFDEICAADRTRRALDAVPVARKRLG